MKFQIGQINVSIDINQILQKKGLTLHINGKLSDSLIIAAEVVYLPDSVEKINISVLVKEVTSA